MWTVGSATSFCKPKTGITYAGQRVNTGFPGLHEAVLVSENSRSSAPVKRWKGPKSPLPNTVPNNYCASTPTPAVPKDKSIAHVFSLPAPGKVSAPSTCSTNTCRMSERTTAADVAQPADHGPDPAPHVACGFTHPTPQLPYEMSLRGAEGH